MTTDRLYDRNFVLAMAAQTGFVVANTLLAHYARWIEFLGGNISQVGSIMGAGAILGLALRPWLGQWINRVGARAMWLIGLSVFTIGALANLGLDGLGFPLYAIRTLLVLGAAIVFASGLTYITQTTPVQRRTEAIGIFGVGGFLGMLIGPALGDLILSTERVWNDFAWMFIAATIANAVSAGLVCCLRKPSSEHLSPALGLRDFITTTVIYWPGTILLVDLVFGVSMTVPFVFLASYVDQQSLQIPGVSLVGLFFWCYAGWALSVRILLRHWPDRLGRRKILIAGMLFMSAGMFIFPWVNRSNAWLIVIPALLTGTGHSLMFHTMTSLTLQSFPNHVRGTGAALALMMLDLGMIAGAPVLGKVAQLFGFGTMFFVIGSCQIAIALVYTWASIPVWQQRLRIRNELARTKAESLPPATI